MTKPLGCSTQLFVGHPLDEVLPIIAESGYQAIELCSRPPTPPAQPVIELGHPSSYYADLKQKVVLHRLEIESLGGTFGIDIGTSEFDRVVEIADMIGLPAITFDSGGLAGNEEAFGWFLNAVNQSSLLSSQANIKLIVKPHLGKSIYSLETAMRFVESIDRDWVGINFDAGQFWASEPEIDPIESLDQLKDYVTGVRIRDCRRGQPPALDETQIPGQGDLEFSAVAELVAEIDELPAVILDLRASPNGSLDDLRGLIDKSIEHLRLHFE